MEDKRMLIELLTQDLIERIAVEKEISLQEAIAEFYNSKMATLLEDEETGLYLQSADYLYELYKEIESIH